MKTVTIKSSKNQTNAGWNRTGSTNWWAAYDINGTRTFLDIAPRRGDRELVTEVTVPEEVTTIVIGAGKATGKSNDIIRETIAIA